MSERQQQKEHMNGKGSVVSSATGDGSRGGGRSTGSGGSSSRQSSSRATAATPSALNNYFEASSFGKQQPTTDLDERSRGAYSTMSHSVRSSKSKSKRTTGATSSSGGAGPSRQRLPPSSTSDDRKLPPSASKSSEGSNSMFDKLDMFLEKSRKRDRHLTRDTDQDDRSRGAYSTMSKLQKSSNRRKNHNEPSRGTVSPLRSKTSGSAATTVAGTSTSGSGSREKKSKHPSSRREVEHSGSGDSSGSDLVDFLKTSKPRGKGDIETRSAYTSMTKARKKKDGSSKRAHGSSRHRHTDLASSPIKEETVASVKEELLGFLATLPKSPKASPRPPVTARTHNSPSSSSRRGSSRRGHRVFDASLAGEDDTLGRNSKAESGGGSGHHPQQRRGSKSAHHRTGSHHHREGSQSRHRRAVDDSDVGKSSRSHHHRERSRSRHRRSGDDDNAALISPRSTTRERSRSRHIRGKEEAGHSPRREHSRSRHHRSNVDHEGGGRRRSRSRPRSAKDAATTAKSSRDRSKSRPRSSSNKEDLGGSKSSLGGRRGSLRTSGHDQRDLNSSSRGTRSKSRGRTTTSSRPVERSQRRKSGHHRSVPESPRRRKSERALSATSPGTPRTKNEKRSDRKSSTAPTGRRAYSVDPRGRRSSRTGATAGSSSRANRSSDKETTENRSSPRDAPERNRSHSVSPITAAKDRYKALLSKSDDEGVKDKMEMSDSRLEFRAKPRPSYFTEWEATDRLELSPGVDMIKKTLEADTVKDEELPPSPFTSQRADTTGDIASNKTDAAFAEKVSSNEAENVYGDADATKREVNSSKEEIAHSEPVVRARETLAAENVGRSGAETKEAEIISHKDAIPKTPMRRPTVDVAAVSTDYRTAEQHSMNDVGRTGDADTKLQISEEKDEAEEPPVDYSEEDIFSFYSWSVAKQSARKIQAERLQLKESLRDTALYRAYQRMNAAQLAG